MKYKNYIAIILIGSFLSSCSDFLEPAPSSSLTTSNYFTTAAELETGLLGVYDAIQGSSDRDRDLNHGVQYEFYVTEMRSDNTSSKTPDSEDASDAGQFENYTLRSTNLFVRDYYSSYFQVIYRANVILGSLGVVTDPDQAAAIEAEAKFLRGYAYFNLVRLFGDLPLIDRVISPTETEIQFTRVDKNLIYDLIVSDLETAVAGVTGTSKNRASKAAAKSLLAKVYLSLESPEYLKAQVLCEEVINSSSPALSLQSNFYNVFYSEGNSEVIWAIGYQAGLDGESQLFSSEWLNAVGVSSGVNYATTDVKAALDAMGGNRTQYSYRLDPLTVTGTNRYQVTKYLPEGNTGGVNGNVFPGTPRNAGNDWIVLRLSDVLLMHVEAIMGSANETQADAALISFNKVRSRAGMPTKTLGVDKIEKAELLDERRVELAFENHRFFDLLRFKAAQSVLQAYSDANNFDFQSTDLLLPIPQNEINLSRSSGTEMYQNPGFLQ
ncbi:RagB/SusD family nutrient uptake outer membrane protein [Mariniflexile sp.]|uniref:RagB/SusD family nutrient uptake outer membrane protein n=1 Tax=Mariniflexile sp. TaxID=1979402 RepID=UPI0035674870